MGTNWKHEERQVAKAFGVSRALMKGTSEKSDIEHPLFCVDAKLRKRWNIERWFDELYTFAMKENKIPVLTVRRPRSKRRLAVVDFDVLIALMKASGGISHEGNE